MRERRRLEAATEGELIAELTDLGALGPPPRLDPAGDTPAWSLPGSALPEPT
jgi:hypothetical protein